MIGDRHKTVMIFEIPVYRNLVVDVVLEHIDTESDGTRVWGLVEAEHSGGEKILDDALPLVQYLGEISHMSPAEWDRIDAEGERLSARAKGEGP